MRKIIFALALLLAIELCLAWGRRKDDDKGWLKRGRGRGRGKGHRHMLDQSGRRRGGLRDWMSGRRSGRYRWGFGPTQDPWFSLGVDFNQPSSRDEPWWSGPNVCYTESESLENTTAEISSHMSFKSVVCDGSDSTFRCIKTQTTPEGKTTVTEIYECCPGFARKQTDFGCPQNVELLDLPTVLETLDLTELTNLLDSTGLSQEIFPSDTNFTIFAPTNKALTTFIGTVNSVGGNLKLQDAPNVIMVSKEIQDAVVEDSRNVLLGHMAVGRYTSPQLTDGQLIETASPFKTNIRINTYQSPIKLTTANCQKLTSIDNVATNGVVHVVDGVLKPVTGSLLDLVSKNPELSTLKTALGSSSFGAMLRDDGHYTLFAPTDAAFKKYQSVLKKLIANSNCLDNVLKNHLFPHIICSSVIEGGARSRNLLQRYSNLTRDADKKVYIDGAQVVGADVMASNGVLHIIDDVLLPDEALGLLELAEKNELTEFIDLVAKAGIKKDLINVENVTVFVPSNDAIQALPSDVVKTLAHDPDYLKSVLQYHMVPGTHPSCSRFHNDLQLDTISGPKLRINEYSTFPFGRQWTRTVQCAKFDSHPITGCNGVVYVTDKVAAESMVKVKQNAPIGPKLRINEYSTVLIPPKGNVVDVLAQDARFGTLVELLKKAGLADALQETGPFTVFAPTDKAFDSLGSDAVAELKQNKGVLSETLQNHVTKDAVCCAGILRTNWINTQKVRTLANNIFEIGQTRRGAHYIGDSHITECDLSATNGVVHVIDSVLMTSPRHSDPFWDYWDQFW